MTVETSHPTDPDVLDCPFCAARPREIILFNVAAIYCASCEYVAQIVHKADNDNETDMRARCREKWNTRHNRSLS